MSTPYEGQYEGRIVKHKHPCSVDGCTRTKTLTVDRADIREDGTVKGHHNVVCKIHSRRAKDGLGFATPRNKADRGKNGKTVAELKAERSLEASGVKVLSKKEQDELAAQYAQPMSNEEVKDAARQRKAVWVT